MVEHISRRKKFKTIEEAEDLRSEALLAAIKAIPKYDRRRKRAFQYFTSVIWNQLGWTFYRQATEKTKWREYCDLLPPKYLNLLREE